MEIAYIAAAAIPSRTANSVHVMQMCEAFMKHGHNVVLIVPDISDKTLEVRNPHEFYAVAPGLKINRLTSIRKFPLGLLNYRFALLAVARAFRLQVEIVYTRNPVVALFSVLFRKAVILELHEKMSSRLPSFKLFRFLNMYCNRFLLKLVVITEPLKRYYLQQGCPADKIMVFPDAVNCAQYEHVEALKEFRSRCRIGYVGSFYQGRGIEMIHAIALQDPDNDYVLYGGSDTEIDLWRSKTESGSNITICGHVPHAEVPGILESMDILLMPYQRSIYGSGQASDIAEVLSPMKMFEYMASGRPIISSDINVLREVLHDGENCLLVAPDSVNAWLAAIQRLKTDQDLAREIACTAQEQVRQKYTWRKRAEHIINAATISM